MAAALIEVPIWLLMLGAVLLGGLVLAIGLLWRRLRRSEQQAREVQTLLHEAIEAMPAAFECWDDDDCLVMFNTRARQFYPSLLPLDRPGIDFRTLLDECLRQGLIPEAQGREQEWLAQRLAIRGKHSDPLLMKIGPRWLQVWERRTASGGLVGVRMDVTEMIEQQHALADAERQAQQERRLLELANAQLARLSTIDSLTGVGNRRSFEQVLAAEWQRSQRSRTPLALLMIDIDHFKAYNDHYGHLAGDHCLRVVALTLTDCAQRSGDLLARWGGEEFALLLPGIDSSAATQVAQRCLLAISALGVPHEAAQGREHLSISVGLCSLIAEIDDEAASLVLAADAALYRAKALGRNRVEGSLPTAPV